MNTARLVELRNRTWHDGTTRRLRPPIRPTDREPSTGWTWMLIAACSASGDIGPARRARIEQHNGFPVPTVASLIGGAS